MSETLTFGPEWLRALSSGNSVTSPPPSPGPKYKLAEHRYGKEEMLALFSEEVNLPQELELFESICRSRPTLPLAFMPLSEEEQRNSVGSVNSNAVLKIMGRGAARGVGPVRGPGRGIRGRGRGDGGFIRQTSYEEARVGEGGGGFGRGADTRRQGWSEPSRGGFERSPSLREPGPSGPGRGGYDPSSTRPRLSSDTSWERPERRSDSGNWRSGGGGGGGAGGEDDDGWRISGQRSNDRSEKWRGGTARGRAPWRGGPDSYRERGHPDEEWQTARSGRRSYHDHEDVRWSSSNERLPEWSNDDSEDFQTPGTFDSSGAFVLQKNDDGEDGKDERKLEEQHEVPEDSRITQTDSDREKTQDKKPEELKEDTQNKVHDRFHDTGPRTVDERRPPGTSLPPASKSPSTEPPSLHSNSPTTSSTFPTPPSLPPFTSASSTKQSRPPHLEPPSNHPSSVSELSSQSPVSPDPTVTTQSARHSKSKKDEEPNMEHFAQAAENLVASLDDDEEEHVDKRTSQQQEYRNRSSPSTPEEVQWSYTDPQGKVQGPFSNSEMADWFSHGYFTMGLLVKRTTDEAFHPLGEIIKQWGRVPFIPGPQPPPFKGVPEHIQRQQQQIIAQQQYQHLMQQHYLQQQLFHQQALMMQQQQLQQNQQQMQQPPQQSPPQSTSPPSNQHSQPQAANQQHMEQQAQPAARPQNLPAHTESIWGPTASPQVTPSIISPGPWSPVNTNAPGKGWDRETSSQQNVPSFEEIQRMEEEKEKQARVEVERREAKARALRLKQEEEERARQLQEAAMLQKQREEEERRQQEEAERRRKEQEELRKKQQEEARRRQEEEIRRKQEQQEALRKQEQQRLLEQQKQQEEQKRMNELRQQQQQAMIRLKQQQQELLRKKEMQQHAEMQQRELQQKLQQKRQESQVTGGSLWGNSPPVSGTMSLAQIQQQEERERQRRELQMQQLQAQQQREQQARGVPGWGERPPVTNQPVKSLLQIQQEQARLQESKKQQGQQQAVVLSRSQPGHNPLSSSVWGSSGPLSASWGSPAGNTSNIWGVSAPKHSQQHYDDDGDDDDDDDSNGDSFWDDAIKAASKSRQPQQAPPQQRQPQTPVQSYPSLSGNKMADKRTNREEENLRRLFRQQTQSDEFSRWCDQSLQSLKATGVDIPTFAAFLKDVESPYEVYDYVKSYLGDSRETREFAREFIERRKKQKDKVPTSTHIPGFPQASVWGMPAPSGSSSGNKPISAPHQLGPFMSAGPVQDDSQDASNKKKRKKKMQKVDPSILGFSVNAADRVNIGEIQSVED